MHDAVAEHGSEHLAFFGIGDDESISTAAPRIALSTDHHTTHSNSLPDSPRISARRPSCACGGLRHRRPHRGRKGVEDWSVCNLLLMVLSLLERKRVWLLSCRLLEESKPTVDECCTALRAKPLNRLLLFCGFTPPELKFRFLPFVCELRLRDQ